MKYRVLLLCLLLAATSATFADVVRLSSCGGSGSCDNSANIQEAINTVTQFGTVPGTVLLQGDFELPNAIIVNVPNLTFEATGYGASLNYEDQSQIIAVQAGADGLTIRGLTLRGYRGILFRGSGDGLGPVNNVSILDNTFVTTRRGVMQWTTIPSSTGWIIRGNQFSCSESTCNDSQGVALILCGSKGIVEDNVITYNGLANGIVIENPDDLPDAASGWSVQDNTVDTLYAISIISGSSNKISGNLSTTTGADGLLINQGVYADAQGKPTGRYGRPAQMNTASNNQFINKTEVGIYVAAGNDGNSLIANKVEISGTIGIGIDLGEDFYSLRFPAATDNQLHANEIAGGSCGINLRLKAEDNIVTGNKISTVNPPLQGIVQEVPNANLVRGNPGFGPITGRAGGSGKHATLLMP